MQRHIRLLFAGLAVTAMLVAAVGTASAQKLSISRSAIRVVWRSLEFSNSTTANVVRCAVTLEGSFHNETMEKPRDLLVGYITGSNVQNNQCTGGRATVLNETLPWHLTYRSFSGILPIIQTLLFNLIRAGFIYEIPGVNSCKVITSIANPARTITNLNTTTGRVEGLRADETARIPLVNGPGGFACSLGTGNFAGTGAMTQLGTANDIIIRLI